MQCILLPTYANCFQPLKITQLFAAFQSSCVNNPTLVQVMNNKLQETFRNSVSLNPSWFYLADLTALMCTEARGEGGMTLRGLLHWPETQHSNPPWHQDSARTGRWTLRTREGTETPLGGTDGCISPGYPVAVGLCASWQCRDRERCAPRHFAIGKAQLRSSPFCARTQEPGTQNGGPHVFYGQRLQIQPKSTRAIGVMSSSYVLSHDDAMWSGAS